jgi:predicted dehydrogenase
MTQATNVGIVGCGNLSGIYQEAGKKWDILNIVACADIDLARAQAQAAKYGIPTASGVAELLADPSIAIVINLTVPQAHAEVALAALAAGKSVYNEKPLALDRGSTWPARRACGSAARRIPFWVAACRPAAS